MNTEINPNEKIVLALGFFDGVHLGHQELINATIKKAKELNIPIISEEDFLKMLEE